MAYSNYGYGAYGYGMQAAAGMSAAYPQMAAPNTFPDDTTGGAYNPRYHFQAAQSAGFDIGGEDTQPKTLYVGNLDPRVTEDFIVTLFGQIGTVTKTKVIYDGGSDPYAFVEFADHAMATQALQTMNKRSLMDREMKVNWATQPGSQAKADTSKHFHVFVGDLSPEVDNKALKEAFAPFGDVSDAKVIRDVQTMKSKGYGFVSYPKREEAERAIEQMNGQWLGRRTIRTNWATRKPASGGSESTPRKELYYNDVYNSTGPDNTSVYVGNVSNNATEDDIRNVFKEFGNIVDIRHFKSQGYSFVKFDSKEHAASAICERNGSELCGQTIRCSWGKTEGQGSAPNPVAGAFNPTQFGAFGTHQQPRGGMNGGNPQNQQYWNYYYQQAVQQNPQMVMTPEWQAYYQYMRGQGNQRP
ncbi:hypothetical protein QR680_012504 [Steinernema hermaphroditum]|uniref:RRM domain-containing protein n=1 Tax=Steinernema hermaphroditum TaxID=289476 RepID=A0AA39I285_9BILA|nr:hypothetical protein QR680_012504 [Steinernema hermaphroditum]